MDYLKIKHGSHWLKEARKQYGKDWTLGKIKLHQESCQQPGLRAIQYIAKFRIKYSPKLKKMVADMTAKKDYDPRKWGLGSDREYIKGRNLIKFVFDSLGGQTFKTGIMRIYSHQPIKYKVPLSQVR